MVHFLDAMNWCNPESCYLVLVRVIEHSPKVSSHIHASSPETIGYDVNLVVM